MKKFDLHPFLTGSCHLCTDLFKFLLYTNIFLSYNRSHCVFVAASYSVFSV